MTRRKKPLAGSETHRPADGPEGGPPAPVAAGMAAAPNLDLRPEVPPGQGFPIVGIGASAGGLAALEAFLSAMPAEPEPGLALVLVQHLAPDHKSILSDLVQRYTRMRVAEVQDGMTVERNCAYIIPPNRDMALLNGSLQLLKPGAPRGLRLPIDFFFRSLAQDQRERAIGVVLSGTGSDGTLGVRAIKGEGGMVMVQAPDSTEFDGMPRSAIATGLVDYVLPPAEMPAQLLAYAAHAFGQGPRPASAPIPRGDEILLKACLLLRAQTGHDFSQYKQNTVLRRMERRMAIQQIEGPEEYLRYLQQNKGEAEALFRDLLIGVTSFFRDPEAFEALRTQVIPDLFARRAPGEAIRVWVPGCSTGEEAYSIAILLQEQMEVLRQTFRVQVFATDVDRQAVERARGARYPLSIAADVSPERLARYFVQEPDGGDYRIQKHVRDLLVFSEQDVIKDPPFSRLDLVSCRNLLIYMGGELQKRLIPLFHYALRPEGVLFLGSSESVGEFARLFAPLDRKWKLYRRLAEAPGAPRPTLGTAAPPVPVGGAGPRAPRATGRAKGGPDLGAVTERALLDHYAQAGVLVNGRGEILHIHGRTGKYLEPAPGEADVNILSMAREGLRRELTSALYRAVAQRQPVRQDGLRVRTNGESITANLTVQPVEGGPGGAGPPGLFLVILEEAPPAGAPPREGADAEGAHPAVTEANGRVARLEEELRSKEEFLQATLEEMETSNEELKSTNEEMQSVNEELQSTNEELETSKEELQSVNEELATVNTELQAKVADLSRANNDMNNLLAGTGVGTLFVDLQLRIARFTPATTQAINLIPSDVGRPVGHLASNLVGYDRLVEDVQAVLETLVPREIEVQTRSGAWYLMRIRTYRTLENVIEGAVITFVDITGLKRAEAALRESLELTEAILSTLREPMLALDEGLRVVLANRAFCRAFRVTVEETRGRLLYELGNRQWDIPELRRLLEEILPKQATLEDYEVGHDFERIGRRTVRLNARRVQRESSRGGMILLAFENVTDPQA